MKLITVLGSTGSIGVQALELVKDNPEQFQVKALVAGGINLELLWEQCKEFEVKKAAVFAGLTPESKESFRKINCEINSGMQAICEIASMPVDVVLNGINGSIGLEPSLATLNAGNTLALANKESMVAGGELLNKFSKEKIIPVDSEHNALYQALKVGKLEDVDKLVLTASGGPFRNIEDLSEVTLEQALAHPTWNMGPVVTINSATLFNKGLEIIEAHYLFGLPYENIEAVIHPQSAIHSLVQYKDGSTIAQASPPSMKLPIGYALNGGSHLKGSGRKFDWSSNFKWEFEPIDHQKFPSIELAKIAGELGQSACATINAANEIAVSAFMDRKLKFSQIIPIVSKVLGKIQSLGDLGKINSFEDVSVVEHNARKLALEILNVNL